MNRRLVRGGADDGSSRPIARTCAIARNAGAKSVADGVETQSDFPAVRELGFDLHQGEMFAKPMTPRKFERTMLDGITQLSA